MAASFTPPAGKGMVYVYRKPAVAYASMIPSFVWVDGETAGQAKRSMRTPGNAALPENALASCMRHVSNSLNSTAADVLSIFS